MVSYRKPVLFEQIEWLLREKRDAPGLVALKRTLADEVPDGDLARVRMERYLPADAPREAEAFRAWIAQRCERL